MTLQPYEILCRWKDDGSFSGGQTLRRDDVTGRISDPLPIGADTSFPWSDVAAEINSGALAQNATLTQQLADATAAQTAAEADAAAQAVTITQLQEQIATLTAPPSDAATALLDKLNTIFAAFPADVQGQFAGEYAMVRVLIQAGQPALAAAVVSGVAVPDALADAKAQILALLARPLPNNAPVGAAAAPDEAAGSEDRT